MLLSWQWQLLTLHQRSPVTAMNSNSPAPLPSQATTRPPQLAEQRRRKRSPVNKEKKAIPEQMNQQRQIFLHSSEV